MQSHAVNARYKRVLQRSFRLRFYQIYAIIAKQSKTAPQNNSGAIESSSTFCNQHSNFLNVEIPNLLKESTIMQNLLIL